MSQESNQDIKQQVAHALHEILNIPDNALNLASVMINAIGVALREKRENATAIRPVLVKTYYNAAIRATIVEDETVDTGLGVKLEEEKRDEEGNSIKDEWIDIDAIEPIVKETLTKIVLSQAVLQPGEVWYITTNKDVEAELEKLADNVESLINRQDA